MRHVVTLFAIALACAGCTVEETDPGSEPVFPKGTGQQAYPDQAAYPSSADWGVAETTVIPNWSFIGFANSQDKALVGLQLVTMADFYNPQGYDYDACVKSNGSDCATKYPGAVYPAGSPWAGKAKPRALSVGVSATWCPPCNQEAKTVLPGKYTKYSELGGHFLVALVDGPQQGVAATFNDVTKWVTKYVVAYSMVTDPALHLSSLFAPLLPSNAIVRTSDMRIMFSISGAPDEPGSALCKQSPNEDNCHYWEEFEKVLASAQ